MGDGGSPRKKVPRFGRAGARGRSEEGRSLFGGTGDEEDLDTRLGFGNVEGELVDVVWNVVPMGLGGDRGYRRTHAGGLTVLTGRERAGCEVTALCSGSPGKELEGLRRWHGAQGIKQRKFCWERGIKFDTRI